VRSSEENKKIIITPTLKILDALMEVSHGYLIIQGHVINTCQMDIERIIASAEYFSKNGVLLNEENMLIENPILIVGKISLFSIATLFNPDYEYAVISFRYLMGTSITTFGDRKVIRNKKNEPEIFIDTIITEKLKEKRNRN
jgi:hypothetical protein